MKNELINNRAMPVNTDHTEPLESKIARWISRSKSDDGCGGWLKFVRLYNKIMSRHQSAFLQDLMNRHEMCRSKSEEWKVKIAVGKMKPKTLPLGPDGYFRCSQRYLLNPKYDSWSAYEQEVHFKALCAAGYIKTQIRKTRRGSVRWVRVDFDTVERGLDRAEQMRIRQMIEFTDNRSWKKPKVKGD